MIHLFALGISREIKANTNMLIMADCLLEGNNDCRGNTGKVARNNEVTFDGTTHKCDAYQIGRSATPASHQQPDIVHQLAHVTSARNPSSWPEFGPRAHRKIGLEHVIRARRRGRLALDQRAPAATTAPGRHAPVSHIR